MNRYKNNVFEKVLPKYDEICPDLKHFHRMFNLTTIETGWDRLEWVNKQVYQFIGMADTYKIIKSSHNSPFY